MFGETLGRVRASYYDDPQGKDAFRAQAYGSMFDMGYSFRQNKKDQQAMEEIQALQRQLTETQMNLAAQSAADEAAYRDRILTRISDMDGALKSSMAKLGPRAQVDGDDIAANYKTFKNQMMEDYYSTVDLVASQTAASSIRRGMDRSTQYSDEQAALISKSADQIPGIHQAAFDAAINRSKGFADAVNSSRQGTFDEITNVLGKAAELESKFVTNNAPTAMSNASTSMTNYANNAANNYADSQTVMGDTMASFNEKIAPNFGYGFGNQAKYNNAEDGAQARFVASLEAQLQPELVDRLRKNSTQGG
jgi:hypothetical protein